MGIHKILMTKALDLNSGQQVLASQELLHSSEGGNYECLYCNPPTKVNVRYGEFHHPHFYHVTKPTNHLSYLTENDDEIHQQLKLFVVNLLGLSIINDTENGVEFNNLKKRMDITYTSNTRKYAIEVQRSSIRGKEIRERNEVYARNGYTPVWM